MANAVASSAAAAAVVAPISDKTSDADRPSIAVPSTRRKSLSATPDVNTGTLPLLMPVAATAAVPRPRLVLAVAPDSATKLLPSPTMKLPLVTARPATSCSCASSLALGTVPLPNSEAFSDVRLAPLPSVSCTVPVALGRVMVRSAVGLVGEIVVVLLPPSASCNTIFDWPVMLTIGVLLTETPHKSAELLPQYPTATCVVRGTLMFKERS